MSAIQVQNLTKTYDGTAVVDGISFSVAEGEIFGIVGPNGAGKTTTVESVAGLRVPDGGTITVLGMHPIKDRYEVTERLGVQLQESRLQDRIKVKEAMELYASFYRAPRDWRDLAATLDLEDRLHVRYKDLSGGQKQRLAVALALIGAPQIAILDELTTGLDPQARRSAWDMVERIRDDGTTVVLVTHFMEEAERLCDRIMVIDDGRVSAIDTPEGLVASVGGSQILRFRPSELVRDDELLELGDVTTASHRGDEIVVAGHGDVVQQVTTFLAHRGVIARGLRVETTSLEDAYLELTNGTNELQEAGR